MDSPGPNVLGGGDRCRHLLAGVAIVTGVLDVLASRLLTAMLVAFGALVWVPALFVHPREHMVWAANAINLALIGAAWVVADSIASRQKQVQEQQDPKIVVA